VEIQAAAAEIVGQVRQQTAPRALILHTCRFGPHSKGDDTRPEAEVERMRFERDPLHIHAPRLSEAERLQIEAEVEKEVAAAFEQALVDPFPSLERQP
jgi:pyruvate dehydrogenase E1 component alpha subunit